MADVNAGWGARHQVWSFQHETLLSDVSVCMVPDQRCCYFHKHIGESAIRAVADAAIEKYGCKTN